jgi:signal transduction histidine kinase
VPASTLLVLLAAALAAALIAASLFARLWLRARRGSVALQERARKLSADLAEARTARETFFDLATHELRSPLTVILGYQELLEDGAYGRLDENTADAVERVGRSARHLLNLIDGVVELSRIRSGVVRPDLEDVNLGVLLASVADAFRTHASDRGIEARVQLPPSLPTVRSDRDRLVRALDLLVTSAVKNPADTWLGLEVAEVPGGATARITGTRIHLLHETGSLELQLGIRVAVADAIARVLGGALDLEKDDDGAVRSFVFRIQEVPAR